MIVKRVDAQTRAKTSINELLRSADSACSPHQGSTRALTQGVVPPPGSCGDRTAGAPRPGTLAPTARKARAQALAAVSACKGAISARMSGPSERREARTPAVFATFWACVTAPADTR